MSDLLIKGMEMPKNCGDCKAFVCYRQWAVDRGDCFCGITKNDAKANEKNADCPLVPVPQHGRLLKVLKTERECVSRDCNRDCGKCDLSLEQDEVLSAYDFLITLFADPEEEGK